MGQIHTRTDRWDIIIVRAGVPASYEEYTTVTYPAVLASTMTEQELNTHLRMIYQNLCVNTTQNDPTDYHGRLEIEIAAGNSRPFTPVIDNFMQTINVNNLVRKIFIDIKNTTRHQHKDKDTASMKESLYKRFRLAGVAVVENKP